MQPNAIPEADLQAAFIAHTQLLQRYQQIWKLTAFAPTAWPWEANAEELISDITAAINQLPNPIAAGVPDSSPALPFWLTNGIGGRKVAQIRGVAALVHGNTCNPMVEWCAGKGHLGRVLGFHTQRKIISIEWQQKLCEQGAALAVQHGVQQTFQHCDVLQTPLPQLPLNSCVVALHACGDLHRQLLSYAAERTLQTFYLAPCCYHLQAASVYQGLSKLAQQCVLQLDREHLKLAVQEQVTGGQRIAKLRDCEQLWRLVFQCYRAQLTGDDSYQPLPSVAKHWFSGELHDFLAWACPQQGLPTPCAASLKRLLPIAEQRLRLARKIDKVRQLFRQPLERWLLLDRALWLSENGYYVRLQTFCDYQQSPRNTIIIASRE